MNAATLGGCCSSWKRAGWMGDSVFRCRSKPEPLAWQRDLKLNDDSTLRIYGSTPPWHPTQRTTTRAGN